MGWTIALAHSCSKGVSLSGKLARVHPPIAAMAGRKRDIYIHSIQFTIPHAEKEGESLDDSYS